MVSNDDVQEINAMTKESVTAEYTVPGFGNVETEDVTQLIGRSQLTVDEMTEESVCEGNEDKNEQNEDVTYEAPHGELV